MRRAGRAFPCLLLFAAASTVPRLAARPLDAISSQGALPGTETLLLDSRHRIRVRAGSALELETLPAPGEGYVEIAKRLAGSAEFAPAISEWNAGARPEPGAYLRVPLAFLSDEYRTLVLLDLFPRDRREGGDWIHVVRSGALPTPAEGLPEIAQWFTGRSDRAGELRKVNALESGEVETGRSVRIPEALLHPALRPKPRSDDGQLVYDRDARGAYAGYRLKPGEAVYSSVVMRFTGRTSPEDVKELSQQLARRSDVADLTDIPVNYLVKIPLDALEPEFLPRDDPRRKEAEASRREQARELAKNPVAPTRGGLKGVLVILDPGHGGRDPGTSGYGIWEHDYVYDVACRLKSRIERETSARVFLTLEDDETGCTPSSGDVLVANHRGTVRSTPPFEANDEGESSVAVNLRWYLANSVFRKAVQQGADPDRVVFVSLHADSRHPSLRGLMVYVPGAEHRTRTVGYASATYTRFQEVREAPHVRYTRSQRVRSEAVSRKLAGAIVDSFNRAGLPTQSYKPVRSEVIRGGERWLPAVLRGNAVPASVLVELLNLGNRDDALLLSTAEARERIASALLRSLYGYFREKPPSQSMATAAR